MVAKVAPMPETNFGFASNSKPTEIIPVDTSVVSLYVIVFGVGSETPFSQSVSMLLSGYIELSSDKPFVTRTNTLNLLRNGICALPLGCAPYGCNGLFKSK
jgi:hypothetical protein